LLAAAIGLGACLYLDSLTLVIVALCVALWAALASRVPFWALVADWISPANRAAAIAAINSIANVSGFVAPFLLGFIKDRTGSFALGLLPMIGLALIGATMIFGMSRRKISVPGTFVPRGA
jgi:ACS family tartrate transporter-like MFS transporter